MTNHLSIFLFALLAFFSLSAEEVLPLRSAIGEPDPLASADALPGGTITEYLGPSPKSLNYYLDANTMSARIFDYLYESLLSMDPQTLEYDRAIASKWTVSEDKKTFTFWIDPKARWSDGRSITAEDVVWTYQAIVDPKNLTGSHKLSLERLNPPEIVDEGKAVRFTAKSVHWENLGAAGGFSILPKHVFASMDFNKINFDFPVVSGPYRIVDFQENVSLTLKKRNDWWRADWPIFQGCYNFETVVCRFFAERENALDAFLKGEIDLFPVYTASQWHEIEQRVKAVRNNWIVKQEVVNHAPIGFQGFAMNMRRPPFDDKRVRKAMALLLDRETMNRTLMYSQYFLHRSYWEDLYDEKNPCPNPLTPFDKEAARDLLAQAGYHPNPQTGILEKDGKPFTFTFLNRGGTSAKFLAIYDQALKDVGIQMNIQNKDWSAWAKDMDSFAFDMTWAAWGAGLFKDPEGMWSSAEATRTGGANICGFQNPQVDELIEKTKPLFDVTQRHEIVRQIDKLIFQEYPYVLLWNTASHRLLYWNKFGTPPTVLGRYSDESTYYWWADPDMEDELKDAMENQLPLPSHPPKVVIP